MTADERAYLISQGISVEGPDTYVDPAEQQLLFPQGLPSPSQQGGLAQTATRSRLSDLLGGVGRAAGATQPQPPPPPAPTEQAPSPSTFQSSDPSAIAEGQRAQRQAGAEASLAHSTGTLVRLIASAVAGGGAGGAAGALGGAEAGTVGGASSGAGFGGGSLAQLLGPLASSGGGGDQQRQLAMLLSQYGVIPWSSG